MRIDEATYQALAKHFSVQQIIEICLNVGLAQITNRFNATFLTDVDDYILGANKMADGLAGPARPTTHQCRPRNLRLNRICPWASTTVFFGVRSCHVSENPAIAFA